MQRRIFIAINLDDKTKKFIDTKLQQWKDKLPLKWTTLDNYHLTLSFAGYIEDQQMEEIVGRLNEVLQTVESFDITLDTFAWGPKKERPKMLWLKGEKNQQLVDLRHLIETAVADYEVEEKEFRPHITLGRVMHGTKKESLPEVEQATNILVPVLSVDVMESVVEKGKRKYLVMERIELA